MAQQVSMAGMAWSAFLVAGLVTTGAGTSKADVKVLQVEADNDISSGLQYAPINFNTSPATVNGITYYQRSPVQSQSTLSGHAVTVRDNLVSYSGGYVQSIYCQEANGYLNQLLPPGSNTTTYHSVKPLGNSDGVNIVNDSWIGNFSSTDPSFNNMLLRNAEFAINRDDLVMVSGAVNNPWTGTAGGETLMWGVRNGIAVRGTQSFDPSYSVGGTGSPNLKSHADLWGSVTTEASYTTPQVAGIAAQIIGQATDINAKHHQVVKSILMTGANTVPSDGAFTWTGSLNNNLDPINGAGRADQTKSLAILNGNSKTFSAISGSTFSSATVNPGDQGWSYLTAASSVSLGQSKGMIIQSLEGFTNLSATLAWDVTPLVADASHLDTTKDVFSHLDLELYQVNKNGNSYTLGAAMGDAGANKGLVSSTTTDNVEHLFYTGTLGAGYYAFVIHYASANNSPGIPDLGFSYNLTSVPEPTLAMGLLFVGGVLCVRRRRA